MKNDRLTIFILLTSILHTFTYATVRDTRQPAPLPAPPRHKERNGIKEKIDEIHFTLSNKILTSTNWIDSFFGNKKSLEAANGSRLRVFTIISKVESDNYEKEFAYKFDFRLPNLQKRLQLSFENNGSNEAQTPTPETKLTTEEGRRIEGFRGNLSYFFKDFLNFKFKLSAGIRFAIPPRLISNFRITNEIKLPYKWHLRSISNSFWEQDEGFGETLSVDFERSFEGPFSFRFVNEATWLDKTDQVNTSHGPSLFQRISPRRAISYNARVNYSNRPAYRLDGHNFNIFYRQNIHQNWFFLEMGPNLSYLRSNNFNSLLGATIKLECLIGSL